MKLQEAIRQLVGQFGESIISEARLANLLADLNGYEEFPAMKQVFKSTLKSDFGKKIYDSYVADSTDIRTVSENYKKQMAKEYNFKADLIAYGFDCLLYGLGCIDSVKEPLTRGYDPYSKSDEDILESLPEMLASLQKEYVRLLDSLIILPNDILHDAPAYYSTDSLTQLYAVEAKIAAVQQQLAGVDVQSVQSDWCMQKRNAKLNFYKNEQAKAIEADRVARLKASREILTQLQRQYLKVLSSNITFPHRLGIKWSGYYDKATLSTLYQIEKDIRSAYRNQGKLYDYWCDKEKAKILAKHSVSPSAIAKQIALKILLPAAILIGATITGASYMSSVNEINQFEKAIAQGEQNKSSGNYVKALQIFDKAKTAYKGSFLPGHYKRVADEHITTSVDAAVNSINTLVQQGKLLAASQALSAIPMKVIASNEDNMAKINEAKANFSTVVDKGLNDVIANISQNKGHLNVQGKDKLKELLSINPNDYWLNIIKNKEQ